MVFLGKSNINEKINSAEETELHLAAKNNMKFSAKSLTKAGADVNTKCNQLETPLHKASHEEHIEMVKMLIKSGASINEKNMNDETALHIAVRKGNKEIVELLIKNGADIDAKNSNEETPIHLAGKLYSIYNSNNIFEAFISPYKDLYTFNKFESILHAAVRNCDTELVRLLIARFYAIDVKDKYGCTPLHVAIVENSESIAKILVRKGANIHIKDNNDQSPFQLAAQLKQKDVLKVLIDFGLGKNQYSDQTALREAVENGNAELVELLINEQTDLNQKDSNGMTMLYTASEDDYESIVRILLTKGADPNVVIDNLLDTPLHIASYCGHSNIVQLLLKNTQINWVE